MGHDVATAWDHVRTRLREDLGWLRTQGWLDGIRLRAIEDGAAFLTVESDEARELARAHADSLRRALGEVAGRPLDVRFEVTRRRRRTGRRPRRRGGGRDLEGVSLDTERVNARQELGGFLTGPANELPLRFAQEVVGVPGRWNPFVVHGANGSGKSHLLHGIANAYRRRHPARRVVFTSGERFAVQLSLTARRRQADRFRELYRRADLLLIDDLHELAGKRAAERELVFTLDELLATDRQVVVAAKAPPKRLVDLAPGLEGRLMGGLVAEIRAADRETRRQIVRARSARCDLGLDDAAFELLLSGFGASVRELLSALTRLEAYRRHVGGPLDVATVRDILSDLVRERLRPATLEDLAAFVAERLAAPVEEQRGRSRKPRIVRARQVAMALCRRLTGVTLREVGAFFGGRSCASVCSAQQRVADLRERDPEVRAVWESALGLFTPAASGFSS